MNAADDARRDVLHQEEVDEAGAGHLGLGDDVVGREARRMIACASSRGLLTGRLGQTHGDVGGEVAVRGSRVRSITMADGVRDFGDDAAGELLQSGRNELFELGFQGVGTWRRCRGAQVLPRLGVGGAGALGVVEAPS